MYTNFFNALDTIFKSFADGWDWLTTPVSLAPVGVDVPPWLADITIAPIYMIGIGTISLVLVASIVKLILDALPIV